MSKKKKFGITILVLFVGFVGLMALGASSGNYEHCMELAQQSSSSNEAAQRFFNSNCIENAERWTDNPEVLQLMKNLGEEKAYYEENMP